MESACNVYISQISIRIVLPTDVIAMLKRHYESTVRTCDIHGYRRFDTRRFSIDLLCVYLLPLKSGVSPTCINIQSPSEIARHITVLNRYPI